uniref:Uncharacterized protein n=1 Tax=Opuntia streptacantha TaxID=393608 RepID=A0A7C8ZVF1_OPUST
MTLFADIFVPIPSNTTKQVIALWAYTPKEESFILRHHRNWDILDTDNNDHGMNSRKTGQKMAKNAWYPPCQLIVKQANARGSYCSKIGSQLPKKIHRHLLLDFSLIFQFIPIIPYDHYKKHDSSKNQYDPASITHTQ